MHNLSLLSESVQDAEASSEVYFTLFQSDCPSDPAPCSQLSTFRKAKPGRLFCPAHLLGRTGSADRTLLTRGAINGGQPRPVNGYAARIGRRANNPRHRSEEARTSCVPRSRENGAAATSHNPPARAFASGYSATEFPCCPSTGIRGCTGSDTIVSQTSIENEPLVRLGDSEEPPCIARCSSSCRRASRPANHSRATTGVANRPRPNPSERAAIPDCAVIRSAICSGSANSGLRGGMGTTFRRG